MDYKKFIKDHNLKKSTYNYQNSIATVDAVQSDIAESSVCPKLLEYIKSSLEVDLSTIPFDSGVLKLYKKEEGLYSGFFEDRDGQVIDRIENATTSIIAKTLETKGYYTRPISVEEAKPEEKEPSSIYIKVGEVEVTIKKSISDFIKTYKSNKNNDIKKAIRAWSRNHLKNSVKDDVTSAKILIENWEENKESYKQTLHALLQNEK